MAVALRPATSDDESFLLRLFVSARAREFAYLPLGPAEQNRLVRMQFESQRRYYDDHFPESQRDIVLRDEQPVGVLHVERDIDSILIVDIALLLEHRGIGIGTQLLKGLQAEGASTDKPVRCHCEQSNTPMIGLVEALGFRRVGESGPYWAYEWREDAGGASILQTPAAI